MLTCGAPQTNAYNNVGCGVVVHTINDVLLPVTVAQAVRALQLVAIPTRNSMLSSADDPADNTIRIHAVGRLRPEPAPDDEPPAEAASGVCCRQHPVLAGSRRSALRGCLRGGSLKGCRAPAPAALSVIVLDPPAPRLRTT